MFAFTNVLENAYTHSLCNTVRCKR